MRDMRPVQPPEVLVLGAPVAWKRPDLALEACALARRTVPELRLRLAGAPLFGDDAVLRRLRQRARRRDLAGAVEIIGDEIDVAPALSSRELPAALRATRSRSGS